MCGCGDICLPSMFYVYECAHADVCVCCISRICVYVCVCVCVCVSLKADYADLDFSVSHWGRENYRKLLALKKRSWVIRVNEWYIDIVLCTYSLSMIARCSGFTVIYTCVSVLMYVCSDMTPTVCSMATTRLEASSGTRAATAESTDAPPFEWSIVYVCLI